MPPPTSSLLRKCSRMGDEMVPKASQPRVGPQASTSEHHHRVPERVEPVPLANGDAIELASLVDTDERHDEGEEGRSRKMEVREQSVDAAKGEPGRDEEHRATRKLLRSRNRLENADRRGAHREDARRRCDSRPRIRIHPVALSVEIVLFEPRGRHGTKGVEADVKRDAHRIEALEEPRCEMKAGGRSGRRPRPARIDGLVSGGVPQRLDNVRRERSLARRLALKSEEPTTVPERLEELHRAQALPRPQTPARARETLPQPVGFGLLEKQDLDRASGRPAEPKPRGHDARVVDDDELVGEELRELGEDEMLDRGRIPPVHEQPRSVAVLERMLRDQIGRQLVVEKGGVHPALRVASSPMDSVALERAKQRVADAAVGRPEPAALEAALTRSRDQVEALASAAAELEATIPASVGAAVRDGLRAEVLPVARHVAEIRGLLNQAIRRLERLEGELLAERHARVDDLALLVDLVSSGWKGVDARLERLERAQAEPARVGAVVEDLAQHERAVEHAAAA